MANWIKAMQSLEEEIIVALVWMGMFVIKYCLTLLIAISTQNFSMFMLLLTY